MKDYKLDFINMETHFCIFFLIYLQKWLRVAYQQLYIHCYISKYIRYADMGQTAREIF